MYSETGALVDDIESYYDNTDLGTTTDVFRRRNKVMQYVNRTRNEIWYWRSWTWTQKEAAVTMSSGKDTVPNDFDQVGVQGGLYDNANGRPWVEINFQEMLTLRKRNVRVNDKLFAVGISTGTDKEILIPNTGSSEQFTLVYKVRPTNLAYQENLEPLPVHFGEALLLGTVARLKEEEGDPRPLWREDFLRAMRRAMQTERESASRVQQMPMAVGRKW